MAPTRTENGMMRSVSCGTRYIEIFASTKAVALGQSAPRRISST